MILVKYNQRNDLKPYFYFALEEYILNNLVKKDQLFFFQWQIKGIVIGKNQIIENEVNLDFVKENNIDVFRRQTGGGCVYNDQGTIIFSIVSSKKDKQFSFKKSLSQVVEALRELGIDLNLSSRNDILLKDKKVSGNAFLQNQNGTIVHGTLLYNCDVDTMVRCITPNKEKLISKGIESVSSRITNLKQHLNGMTQEQLINHLNNFLTNEEYVLSDEEIATINKMAEKYASKEWIFGEHPQYDKKINKRFDWGYMEILLSLKKGKIEEMFLKGDFFHKNNQLPLFLDKFKNTPYNENNLQEILKDINIGDYILNATNEDFLSLLNEGILKI
ncbi:lipoate--protein ligase ['Camptotheca acuminata' phytoplasma]|uniref:lipoate--protein ligase n=1 Tax='Camptotheca acuminata' phytoplasma TaxID=3239192 RepID=UPI003519EAF7